jgi:hypothetical protein
MAKQKENGWGGSRPGAGRPRKNDFLVEHGRRPKIDPAHPLLITLRIMDDVSLEDSQTWAIIREAVGESAETTPGFEAERLGREGSLLLMLVNAKSRKALTIGMQGLSIKIARRLNRLHARTGRIFKSRYESEALDSKRAIERALARF